LVGFVSLMNALAWPVATLGIACLFRREIRAAMGRVGQFKYRDLEVTFREELRQAETLARALPTAAPLMASSPGGRVVLEAETSEPPELGGVILAEPKGPTGRPAPAIGRDALDRLAARSPRDAVLESWAAVGHALVKAAATLGDRRAPAPTRAEDAARFLVDRGWLAGPEARLVDRLRALRDRAADPHDPDPGPDEARRYVDLAWPLAARIEALG